ncbi:MAG: hypothetical protein IT441_06180 [Phycisphaeraceae bacterium]|nr:hypothetical protein [Phycisphaeraceae bacterium]
MCRDSPTAACQAPATVAIWAWLRTIAVEQPRVATIAALPGSHGSLFCREGLDGP